MLQIFKYRFKIMISNRFNIFWVLIFPLALVSLFHLAFSNISQENLYKGNKVGIVTTNKNSLVLKTMREVKDGNLSLFQLEELSEKEALKKLEADELSAVVEIDHQDNASLKIKNQGMRQLMVQKFLDKYKQNEQMIKETLAKNPGLAVNGWLSDLNYNNDAVKDASVSDKSNNLIIVSFYSAIAMACLFGTFLSVEAPKTLQPNISYQGARVYVSPVSKWHLVISDLISSFSLTLVSLILLILYMNDVLKIEFSNQLGFIMLIITLGSLFATCFGYFLSLIFKKKEAIKVGVILAVTMGGSFLSGMMAPSLKYVVEQAVPLAKYLNPVALITDSLNALYYYNDFKMIQPSLLCLAGMSAVMILGSWIILRRDRYDSI